MYREYAANMPILDYHCHLPVEEIADDKKFTNLTQIWINGDHYKWRAMRTLGIEEKYITGDGTDEEKFQKWAETIPYTMRNPLYHWTHLELKRYFGVDELLNGENAKRIYDHCNQLLATKEFSARNLLRKMNVKVVCTTDDPASELKHHRRIAEDGFEVKILPTFRPDRLLAIEHKKFGSYITRISGRAQLEITGFTSLLKVIENRIDFFHEHGCRLSDHGLDYAHSEDFSAEGLEHILSKRLAGEEITASEILEYRAGLMFHMGKMYAAKKWAMQLHLGPVRDVNTTLLEKIGINAGVDSIGDFPQAKPLGKFLDSLNREGALPKTILYNVNSADNDVLATMAGNFMSDSQKGKIQHGSAWWFLDQKDGIEKQLNAISNMGLLSSFVGMLTDSRSFLSMTRHEYFRRILCNLFGNDIQRKELPEDIEWIGKLIKDICYYNAQEYFDFPED